MRKLDVKKIVEAMKEVSKENKIVAKTAAKAPFNPTIKPGINVRDMRKEAIDMGSHNAKTIFEEGQSE